MPVALVASPRRSGCCRSPRPSPGASGDDLAVLRLKYRVRGWNGNRQDPVQDARWALDRIRRALPGIPVVARGSLDGRPGGAAPQHRAGRRRRRRARAVGRERRPPPSAGHPRAALHGSHDRVTDPRRTGILAKRLEESGVDVRHVSVEGGDHPMLRKAALWHDTVADFVTDAPVGPARTS